ncbi:MAG TPA: DMT family transporter [Arcobacter sp.]|jgi:drug/metabolite transporter (DMT)-like permease|nr:DMT family transporter [Arcobacter sp.]
MKSDTQNSFLFYFLLVLAMVFWASSWISAKVFSEYINAYELMVYRYFLTTISFVPILLYLKKSFVISKDTLLLALLSTLFMILYSKFFFDGTMHGTAGLGAAFVTTLNPIITFILSLVFFKKELRKKDIFALLLGAVGIFTILNVWSFEFEDIFVIANLFFILAAFSWALLTLNNSRVKTVDPLVLTFYIYLFTTLFGYFITPFESGNIFEFDFVFWFNLILISIGSTTFATSFYFIAISKIGASKASSFIFLVPFNAIFLSYLFLDEPIYYTTIIGTILSIIAVSMLNNAKNPFKRNG